MTNVQIFHIDQLALAEDNPRQTVDPSYIDAMAESLVEIGLIQPLSGLPTETGADIYAGGCRMRALRIAVERRPELAQVPVVMAKDIEQARLWSLAENEVRRSLRPAAMVRATRLAKARGDSVDTISRILGTTNAEVYRALRLAEMPDDLIDALDDEKISWDQAKSITLADNPERVAEALEWAIEGKSSHTIKNLLRGSIAQNDFRVKAVGIDAIEAAGAKIIHDLFDENVTIEGEDIVDKLFAVEIEKMQEAKTAEGWGFSHFTSDRISTYDIRHRYEIMPTDISVMSEDEKARHEELSGVGRWQLEDAERDELDALEELSQGVHSDERKALSGVLFYVTYSGELTTFDGIISENGLEAVYDAGYLDRPVKVEKPKPQEQGGFSAKLLQDLHKIQTAAIGSSVLDKTDLALDILAFQLSGEVGYESISSVTVNYPQQPIDDDAVTANEALYTSRSPITSGSKKKDLSKRFAEFREKGKAHRNAVLAQVIASSLVPSGGGSKMAAALEEASKSSMRDIWTPNADNFFGRISIAEMREILVDVLKIKDDDEPLKSFDALKRKGEKATFISDIFASAEKDDVLKITSAQRKKIDAWTPEI